MEDTNNTDDGPLGAAMRDYLSAELDPQLGRAAARFRHHLRGPDATSTGGGSGGPGKPGRWGGWVVGIVGGAMAASIAALWAGPALWPPKPTRDLAPVAQYHFDLDDVTLCTQTRDGGTVVLDGRTPVRRIYRNQLKQSRWFDAAHDVSVEKIEPRQEIMLIEMDTY